MRKRSGFTLVELLVVIGIIALLISILLPSLNRARQQANLIKCQSNIRQIGVMLLIYNADNKGFAPYGIVSGNYATGAAPDYSGNAGAVGPYNWVDTISLMMKERLSKIAGYPNTARQYSKVFGDADTQTGGPEIFYESDTKRNHYQAHPRIFAILDTNGPVVDPFGSKPSWSSSKLTKGPYRMTNIRRSSETFMIWCGAQDVNQTAYSAQGATDAVAVSYDAYRLGYESFGYYPAPPSPYDGSVATWTDYEAQVNLGDTYETATLTALRNENRDYSTAGNTNYHKSNFRFRHMKNTTINLLGVDGHVESRQIGNLKRKEVCVQR